MLVALSGNMIINYAAGTLIEIYGERSFIYVIIAQIAAMIALLYFYQKNNNLLLKRFKIHESKVFLFKNR